MKGSLDYNLKINSIKLPAFSDESDLSYKTVYRLENERGSDAFYVKDNVVHIFQVKAGTSVITWTAAMKIIVHLKREGKRVREMLKHEGKNFNK